MQEIGYRGLRAVCAIMLIAMLLVVGGCGSKKEETKAPAVKKSDAKNTSPNAVPSNNAPNGASSGDISGILGGESSGLNDWAAAKPAAPANLPNPASPAQLPLAPPMNAKSVVKKPLPQRPTAGQLFEAVRLFYATTKTISVDGTSSMVVKHDGKVVRNLKSSKFSTIFKHPDKIVMKGGGVDLYSNGKKLVEYSDQIKKYKEVPTPKDTLTTIAASRIGIGIVGLLIGVDYSKGMSSMELLKDEKLGKIDTWVLSIKWKPGVACPKDSTAVQKLWIGKNDLSVRKNELRIVAKPKLTKEMVGKVPKLIEETIIGNVTGFHTGEAIPDSKFSFKPPAGAKKLEKAKPVDLKSKLAPDFTFKTGDGTERTVASMKGKPVVMVIWALPMCDAFLPVMNGVYEKNKDGVEFLAVNVNTNRDEVQKYLDKKKMSFPFVSVDEKSGVALGKSYGITAVPTVVLIDSLGVVKESIPGGVTPEQFEAKIKKLQ